MTETAPVSAVQRRRRYDRAPLLKPLKLTERMKVVLRALDRFDSATIDQLHRIDRKSKQKLSRLLRDLFDAGYVVRKREHILNPWDDCYAACVYGLDVLGYDFIASERKGAVARYARARDGDRQTKQQIDHAVATADVMVHFLAEASHHGLALVDHLDLAETFPLATRSAKKPFSLPIDYDGERHLVTPDRLFSIYRDSSRYNFTLELDTGHEPLHRFVTLELAANPSAGASLDLAYATSSWRLTFVETLSGKPGEIVIAGSPAETRARLMAAINAPSTAAPFYTPLPDEVLAAAGVLSAQPRRAKPAIAIAFAPSTDPLRITGSAASSSGARAPLTFAATGTSYAAKLPHYLHAFLNGLHTDRWGFTRVRFLTVTSSETRLSGQVAALNRTKVAGPDGRISDAPPGLFLFTTMQRLRTGSPLGRIWTNRKGELVDLAVLPTLESGDASS